MTRLLALEAVTYCYPDHDLPVLDQVSLELMEGETLGILGKNGSGKSTLLHLATGLLRPASGRIFLFEAARVSEKDFVLARQELGYLLQRSDDMLFCPSILEDVAFGPYNAGLSRKEAEEKAWEMLGMLSLEHLANRNANSLSGGEKKLAALACILVSQPRMLFLDEPTNDLDPRARERLMEILSERRLPGILISHDQAFLRSLCTRFGVMDDCALRETSFH